MLYRPLLDIADRGASMGRTTSEQRFNMLLVTAFAGLALLLAVIGLYGVVSYAVTQRTSEIGVRLALGATDGGVSRMVVRQGLKPAIWRDSRLGRSCPVDGSRAKHAVHYPFGT